MGVPSANGNTIPQPRSGLYTRAAEPQWNPSKYIHSHREGGVEPTKTSTIPWETPRENQKTMSQNPPQPREDIFSERGTPTPAIAKITHARNMTSNPTTIANPLPEPIRYNASTPRKPSAPMNRTTTHTYGMGNRKKKSFHLYPKRGTPYVPLEPTENNPTVLLHTQRNRAKNRWL